MANTYTLIASSTVGAVPATSIDFTSIPSTYTDLILKVSARDSNAIYREIFLTINGSTANGTAKVLSGNGAAASSYNATRVEGIGYTNNSTTTANTFTSVDFYIPNYAGSTNKSFSADGVGENNATTAYAELTASLWSQTAAITSISVVLGAASTFSQYSTAYLYGVKNA
jgi:hypothetical protein